MSTRLSGKWFLLMLVLLAALLPPQAVWSAELKLSDEPTNAVVPLPNVLFTPSVEYPTPSETAHKGNYDAQKEYLGYFDPSKCYTYNSAGYFEPASFATGNNHNCASSWSGNALNFATMGGIDTFRWALTGGTRSIDTASTSTNPGVTVLQRSYQTGNSTLSGRAIPSPSGSVAPNSVGKGTDMVVGSITYRVAVRVCDDRKGEVYRESNCAAYTDPSTGVVTYKPVGLIQRYQDRMRFGVFSYLLNRGSAGTGEELDGGVMRARLKSVGPFNWNNTLNSNVEWNPSTGVFVTNPDADDASSSHGGAVTNSGVVNYLNKFGFEYKEYSQLDQPSEMYGEALRYLMHKSPTSGYYNYVSAKKARGENFPVIVNWWKDGHDSVLSYCQKNAIVGIGDVNTHYEQNLGDLAATAASGMSEIASREGLAVQNICWGNGANPSTCSNGGTNKIAGLARYAHQYDLRPDLTARSGVPRKVTVDSFWVDVLEPSPRAAAGYSEYVHKNQYWLLAKYGGMSDAGQWNKNGRFYKGDARYPLPDNYFPASDPKAMVDSLEAIFTEISASSSGSGAGAGWAAAPEDSGGVQRGDATHFYKVQYSAKDWSGSLEAHKLNGFAADGSVNSTKLWDAADKLIMQNWDTGRRIVTYTEKDDGSGGIWRGAVPFRFDKLSDVQKALLGGSAPAKQEEVLKFLRGDRSKDGTNGYRLRGGKVLGDIVHSKPVQVSAPQALYQDDFNPGYSDFVNRKASRMEMVYVGGNDGMLHAFKGVKSGSGGGEELWAYIPSFLFQGSGNPALPDVDGLQALSKASYKHRYYVNATAVIEDVDFYRTGKNISADDAKSDWRTILVGGLGKGGKGFFAIDITDPESMTSESSVAGKVLWEFTDKDMGFSFGRPLVTKTRKWGWVVILTSGYNNDSGKGVLYVLNAKTGEPLARIETGAGSPAQQAGLAQVSGYTQDYRDYMTDQVYGGDLLGNLWRFDFTGDKIVLDKIAELKSSDDKPQPITSAPLIETIKSKESLIKDSRWVLLGTGQWLSSSDIDAGPGVQQQTMYAIRDGTASETEVSGTLNRSDLKKMTDLTVGLSIPPEKGWYYDMTGVNGLSKERVTFSPVFVSDTVVWAGIMPGVVEDECKIDIPRGKSRIYAVKVDKGLSVLTSSGKVSGYVEIAGLTTDVQIIQSDGNLLVATSLTTGGVEMPGELPGPDTINDSSSGSVINMRIVE